MLRKHIGEKVKGVHYGSSTEVRDPLTRMIETKPLKPFLVNQTVLMLERGQIRIPHLDTSEVLHRQMTNFQVVRISEKTQEPTYTDVDEHGLDAMIFAIYSFLEEYPDLVDIISENILNKIYADTVITVPYFNSLGKNIIIINNLKSCSMIFDKVCGNIFCFPKKYPLIILDKDIKGNTNAIDIIG